MKRVLTLGLALLCTASAVQVGMVARKDLMKEGDKPLGDIYVMKQGQPAQRLTTWGHNFSPVTSPDGRYAVYQSLTKTSIARYAYETSQPGGPPSPFAMNLYLIDLKTLNIQKLTTGENISRSPAVWSPDLGRFAWTEFDTRISGTHLSVMVYQVSRRAAQVRLRNAPFYGGQGSDYFPGLYWRRAGVAVMGSPLDDSILDCVLLEPKFNWRIRRTHVDSFEESHCLAALGLH